MHSSSFTSSSTTAECPALEPVLSSAAMRAADAYTIDAYGIPSFTLMELAGRAAVAEARSRFGPLTGQRIVLFCGKGNNGGDGFVMARGFVSAGATVQVVNLADPASMTQDARLNYELLVRLLRHLEAGRLELTLWNDDLLGQMPPADLYVDALLGTGLSQALRPPITGIVEWLNRQQAGILAVDMPTGLHADHGTVLGSAVSAHLTVTMGAAKTGLHINDGPAHAGEVRVAEIGIPRHALRARVTDPSCGERSTDAYVRALLPRRAMTAHKYSVGMTLAVAGSPGLTGAPVMAATAAARIGSGAVVVATHEEVQPMLAARLTEVMTLALPGRTGGELDPASAMDALTPRLEQASALLVGCGLGRTSGTGEFVRQLCAQTKLPMVLDADGLNALAGHTDLMARFADGRWVLTPHAGEFRRLAGEASLDDRLETVRTHARKWNCVLLLKGMPTVVGSPDGRVFVCGTGNPALATAGTGDVLAGFIAGLLAQGLSATDAAVCGAHIGGAAADYYARHRSPRTLQAMDLIRVLPRVLRDQFDNF